MPEISTERARDALTRLAIRLSTGAAVVGLALGTADDDTDDAWWLLMPVLALAAVVIACIAGGTSPRNLAAFLSLVVGLLCLLGFLAVVISDL